MARMKKMSPTSTIFAALIFAAVGIVGLIISAVNEQQENAFMSTAESCVATVDSVHSYTTRSRRRTTRHYDAYVSYTVNNVNYTDVKISNVSSSVSKGDLLTIYYNPSNPSDCRLKTSSSSRQVSYVMWGIITLIGVGILLVSIIVVVRQKRISEQNRIYPQDVVNNTSNTYNGYYGKSQTFSNNQDIYNPNSNQTYNGYGSNSFDTYNGYSQNDNSNSFNSQQSSPFDTYGNNSQNDTSKPKSPFDRYNN
ncbi:MAG: DUF3592 domain-containing protein [Clostridia bacterium]|nr:DUF3592 domain-containing protein [Clostridia bacterium]